LKTHVIVYTPKDSDPILDINAIVKFGASENAHGIKGSGVAWRLTVERDFRSDLRSNGTRHVATVGIMVSDIATPEYGDTIEIDGAIWTVKEVCDHA
jgi:hypothetical protein